MIILKKITIGLFIDTFFPMVDGVIMVVDNYAKRLGKYANVVVFAPSIPRSRFDDSTLNYKVVRCKSVKVPTLDYSLPIPNLDIKFVKELRDYDLDIVHIHSPMTMGSIGVKYAKEHNKVLVGTMHSQYKQDFLRVTKSKRLSNKLTKNIIKIYDECDECWAVNSEVARIFYEDYHYKKYPKVMNNATEMLPVLDREKSINRINKLYSIDDEFVFLFVGRINKLKNVFFIVDALNELKNKIKFKMLFVGTGQDEKELKKYIKELGLTDKIILCGKVSDRKLLSDYYVRSDLFLFPSLYDASSIVQIEAASQKCPSLFVEGAATAATIKDNVNGFIAKNNYKDYAKRILEIMNDKNLYNKVREMAFKDIYKTWDDAVKEVYDSYVELLESR